jgi:hypothetical protein
MVDYVHLGLCTLDCRAAEDESDRESLPILSNFRSVNRRKAQSLSSAVGDENEPSRRKAVLMQRLEKFQSKGWLSQQEFQKYRAFLSTYDKTTKIGENGSFALKELEVELNLTESRIDGTHFIGKTMLTPTKGKQGKQSAINVLSNESSRSMSKSTKNLRYRGNNTNLFSDEIYMHQRTITQPSTLSTSVSEDGIATLFVETCFFGRLGFVQPPCCLQCTYREAVCKSALPRLHCKRWVIWRKDANHPLHGSNVCENAMAVQCQSARKLTTGDAVESYKWDRRRKILREPPSFKIKK